MNREQVFLNVPYDRGYEKLLVALVATVVAHGAIPRMTLEVPDQGQGRMKKLSQLLNSCDASFHDLSRVGLPARFNMPFELGLAVALQIQNQNHKLYVLEKEPFRVQKTLSDINHLDALIHKNSYQRMIAVSSGVLSRQSNVPTLSEIKNLASYLIKAIPKIKEDNLTEDLFELRVFKDLLALTIDEAHEMKLVS